MKRDFLLFRKYFLLSRIYFSRIICAARHFIAQHVCFHAATFFRRNCCFGLRAAARRTPLAPTLDTLTHVIKRAVSACRHSCCKKCQDHYNYDNIFLHTIPLSYAFCINIIIHDRCAKCKRGELFVS